MWTLLAIFVDTSALLKVYATEKGTETMRSIVANPSSWDGIFISEFTQVEMAAALGHKLRRKEIEHTAFRLARSNFVNHYEIFERVLFGHAIMHRATQILLSHNESGIGAGDAIQLASAEQLGEMDPPPRLTVFVCSDKSLRNVASDLGFPVFDPEQTDMQTLVNAHAGLGEGWWGRKGRGPHS